MEEERINYFEGIWGVSEICRVSPDGSFVVVPEDRYGNSFRVQDTGEGGKWETALGHFDGSCENRGKLIRRELRLREKEEKRQQQKRFREWIEDVREETFREVFRKVLSLCRKNLHSVSVFFEVDDGPRPEIVNVVLHRCRGSYVAPDMYQGDVSVGLGGDRPFLSYEELRSDLLDQIRS